MVIPLSIPMKNGENRNKVPAETTGGCKEGEAWIYPSMARISFREIEEVRFTRSVRVPAARESFVDENDVSPKHIELVRERRRNFHLVDLRLDMVDPFEQ